MYKYVYICINIHIYIYYIYLYIYIYIYICVCVCVRVCVCVCVYIWLTISSCYGSIPLTLGLIGGMVNWALLCHSCGFACQQRVLKTFPCPSATRYLRSEYGIVWLWHLLVNLYNMCVYVCVCVCVCACLGLHAKKLGSIGG